MVQYSLTADPAQISSISSMRVMVAAALLYAISIHFLFVAIMACYRDDVKKERIYDHGRRWIFFGVAALLSINFLQYGIYHAILAWLTLICVFIMLSMTVMREIRQMYQNLAVTLYYTLITIWFCGITFFYIFNALV